MNRAERYHSPRYQHAFPHRCLGCGDRKARFQYRGRVYADRRPGHDKNVVSVTPKDWKKIDYL